MPYISAVLARTASGWRAAGVDVEDAEDLGELVERLRGVAVGERPVVLLLEREDAWFAIVRVDGDEDPKVFVSDAGAARNSPYAEALGLHAEDTDEGPIGDLDVLADLGTDAQELDSLVGEEGPSTSDAVGELAEKAGFAELLDAMR